MQKWGPKEAKNGPSLILTTNSNFEHHVYSVTNYTIILKKYIKIKKFKLFYLQIKIPGIPKEAVWKSPMNNRNIRPHWRENPNSCLSGRAQCLPMPLGQLGENPKLNNGRPLNPIIKRRTCINVLAYFLASDHSPEFKKKI